MPKKTKKEKLLAELHRKTINFQGKEVSLKIPLQSEKEHKNINAIQNKFVLPTNIKIKESNRPNSLDSNYSFVYKDLFRIAIFSLLAISLQFVLVLLLRTK